MAEITAEQLSIAEEHDKLAVRELDKSYRADIERNLTAGSGTNDLLFERVPDGKVLVIEHLSGRDDTSAPTRIRIGYKVLNTFHTLRCVVAPLTTESVELLQELRLREGMMPVVRIEGATSGDDLYGQLLGYWIPS